MLQFARLLVYACSCSALAPLRMPPITAPDRPITYSNPQGATLTRIRDDVWWGERSFYPRIPGLSGFDVACKMTVVRLKSGDLWVCAPVALDAKTKEAVDALGPVRHIVTPNTEHLKWARDWIRAYPEATSYACPGLMERKPEIGYDAEVGDVPPAAWADEFDVLWVEEERSPFKLLGDRPFFSEVIFCHKPSKVLLTTDLWWNYPNDAPAAWKFGMDRIFRPVYNGLMKQPGWEDKVSRIFGWDWDFLAPCHGEPICGPDVKKRLAEHLDYAL